MSTKRDKSRQIVLERDETNYRWSVLVHNPIVKKKKFKLQYLYVVCSGLPINSFKFTAF